MATFTVGGSIQLTTVNVCATAPITGVTTSNAVGDIPVPPLVPPVPAVVYSPPVTVTLPVIPAPIITALLNATEDGTCPRYSFGLTRGRPQFLPVISGR